MNSKILWIFYMAWFFTFSLHTTPDRKIQNITTFARIYGYVRFFHPSDEAANLDWESFAIYGGKMVENAKTSDELKEKLNQIFLPIAPSIKIYKTSEKVKFLKNTIIPKILKDKKTITWQHSGVSLSSSSSVYRSIRLNRSNEFAVPSNIGNIVRRIDPSITKIQGKRIKLRALVKANVKRNFGKGQVWLRVDLPGKKIGFIANMDDRPILDSEWRYYELVGRVADDATKISFGCFLNGGGKLWVDDFQLFVRNSDEWEKIDITNMNFDSDKIGNTPNNWLVQSPNHSFSVIYRDEVQNNKCILIESKPQKTPKMLFTKHAEIGEVIFKEIGSGLSCIVPLALFGDNKHTYPKADKKSLKALKSIMKKNFPKRPSGEDIYVRLAGIVITYNIFQHFYPYFDVVKTNWEEECIKAIKSSYYKQNNSCYLRILKHLVSTLKDGHAYVYNFNSKPTFYLPIQWTVAQNLLVIEKFFDNNLDILPGDIVVEINGKKTIDVLKDEAKYISASTTGYLKYKISQHLLRGPKNKNISLNIQRGNDILNKQLKHKLSRMEFFNKTKKTTEIQKKVGNGIYYIDLCRIKYGELKQLFPVLQKQNTIILDIRGYPRYSIDIIDHLIPGKDNSNKWLQTPQIIYPDFKDVTYETEGWDLKPKKPYLKPNRIFILNSRAISAAESFMSFIEHYRLGTIIGQQSAGTNGNINGFFLPGNYKIGWTGMKVIKHDGSTHHGVGIKPHIVVERTIKGIQEGRDEFLEKAIEIAKKK